MKVVHDCSEATSMRLFRDKSTYFFVFIFPLALILLIGLQFGGGFLPAGRDLVQHRGLHRGRDRRRP